MNPEPPAGNDSSQDETLKVAGVGAKPPPVVNRPGAAFTPMERQGDLIGHYRLLHELGRGGFGIVWHAEQTEPIRREVALKVIKPGMDTGEVIARFESERQALALMDHPNIAGVLDAGATASGRPYFVMELVKGVPITEYCDAHKLSIRQRLELFIPVCQAVQHAHQKAILHRDLKPANILVTEVDGRPVPKVIDFGIAKALGITQEEVFNASLAQTQQGAIVGTLQYMSPEQAGSVSDVDTRSDIYTLGVILYELLVGDTPLSREQMIKAALDEVLKLVREADPKRPSSRFIPVTDVAKTTASMRFSEPKKLGHALRGDLDWIVLKALEKDRTRRYDTANAFAQDLQRHLNDEPVSAGPPSAGYRLRKLVRRNRLAFSAAGSILVLLAAGVSVSTWLAVRASRAEAETKAKNTALQQQLREAARSDWVIAKDLLAKGRPRDAFAYLARSCEYNPDSLLPAETAVLILNTWSLQSPVQIHSLQGHWREVMSAQFSPDGQRIVTASEDQTARVWDANNGTLLATLQGRWGPIVTAEFSPDGKRIVTASLNNTARVWDANSGKLLATLAEDFDGVTSAHFSSDGQLVVTASSDARVWDADSGKLLATLRGHEDAITSVQFSPDGKLVVTASHDRTARLWEAATGKLLFTFEGRYDAQFSPDGQRIVTASNDKSALVWQTTTGKLLTSLLGHGERVRGASFSPDGKRIVTASSDARVWDANNGKLLATLKGHEGEITSVQFSPDGEGILTTSNGEVKTARVWDSSTGSLAGMIEGHQDLVNSVQFSRDGQRVVTASSDKTARVWGIASGKLLVIRQGSDGGADNAQLSPNGELIVKISTARNEYAVQVFRTADGKFLSTLKGHKNVVTSAKFSPDGKRIVTASGDSTAKLWEATTGMLITTFQMKEGTVWSAEISPDGQRVATASSDNTANVWDTATGKVVTALQGHTDWVWSAQFSKDGRRILTASGDNTARVWDANSGKLLSTLQGNGTELTSVQFSPDGNCVTTASNNKAVQVWEAASGDLLATLVGNEGIVRTIRFGRDGRHIITTSEDKTVRAWEALNHSDTLPQWLPGFLRVLALRKLNASGELATLTTQQADQLRTEIAAKIATDSSHLAEIARWFLTPADKRPPRRRAD